MRIVVSLLAALLLAPAVLLAQHVLTIPGEAPTRLATAAGGTAAADVIEVVIGSALTPFRHLGNPHFEPIELSFAPQQCSPLYGWISATLGGSYEPKRGAIQTTDASGRVRWQIEFFDALVSRVTLPATGAQGDDAMINVALAADYARLNFPGGRVALPAVQAPASVRTVLSLVDLPTVEVQLELITIAIEFAASPDPRDHELEPSRIEFPNLKLTIPDDALVPFLWWHSDFVVSGNNDQGSEKSGSIAYLSQSGQPLMTLDLSGVGIAAFRPLAAGGWEAVLYVEQASLSSACAP